MPVSWVGWLSDLDPRLSIVAAALPSVGSGLWVWLKYRNSRADERADKALTREERRTRDLDQQQSTFGQEQAKWFAEIRQENRDLRTELNETRVDRDRGWDLARWWHNAAHDLLRHFRNLRHNAMNQQQWIQSAVRQMRGHVGPDGEPLLKMPEAIEAVPDRPDLPMGLEDPK